jgi:hypothetical protein
MPLTTERDIRTEDKPFQHALAVVLALQSSYHETWNSEQKHEQMQLWWLLEENE